MAFKRGSEAQVNYPTRALWHPEPAGRIDEVSFEKWGVSLA